MLFLITFQSLRFFLPPLSPVLEIGWQLFSQQETGAFLISAGSGGWKRRHRLSNLIFHCSRTLIPAASELLAPCPTSPPSTIPACLTLLHTDKDLILTWFFCLFTWIFVYYLFILAGLHVSWFHRTFNPSLFSPHLDFSYKQMHLRNFRLFTEKELNPVPVKKHQGLGEEGEDCWDCWPE